MLSVGGFVERRQGSFNCLDLERRVTHSIFGEMLATTGMVLLCYFGMVDSHRIMRLLLPFSTAGVGLIKRQQALRRMSQNGIFSKVVSQRAFKHLDGVVYSNCILYHNCK